MSNKQSKILTNQIAQLEKEVNELSSECNKRLEMLARSDGIYQNLQGQLIEKKKRVTDYQNFISLLVTTKQENEKEDEPRGPGTSRKAAKKDKPTKPTKD